MNQQMYESALERIEEISLEELAADLQEFGFEVTLRQYPEPLNTDEK